MKRFKNFLMRKTLVMKILFENKALLYRTNFCQVHIRIFVCVRNIAYNDQKNFQTRTEEFCFLFFFLNQTHVNLTF